MADSVKKATLNDLQEIIRDLGKSQRELSESQKKTEKSLRESQKELSESQKKTAKSLRESQKELSESQKKTEESLRESQKKTEESLRKSEKKILQLHELFTGQWGKLMESLIEGDLINLLRKRNIPVNQVASRRRGEINGKEWEIDLLAIDGNEIVVVEVKTTLKVQDVKDFENNILKPIKTLLPEYKTCKTYGAVAYLKADQKAGIHAEKKGLFVIRATGNSSSITNKEGFKPAVY